MVVRLVLVALVVMFAAPSVANMVQPFYDVIVHNEPMMLMDALLGSPGVQQVTLRLLMGALAGLAIEALFSRRREEALITNLAIGILGAAVGLHAADRLGIRVPEGFSALGVALTFTAAFVLAIGSRLLAACRH